MTTKPDPETSEIEAFRLARGWSQNRMAAELGVNQSTISRLEVQGGPMKPLFAAALADLARRFPADGDPASDAPQARELKGGADCEAAE